MKLFSLLFTFCFAITGAFAQNLKTPPASPSQTVKQEFALSTVELSYSRPSMKEREIFGKLVPYGKVWRTGANAATTITFGDEVTIGGKKIPAGKYGLLTIPNQNEWTVIISKQTDVTGPAAYKEDQDVVRFTASSEQLPFSVQTFTITFDNIKATSMEMMIIWDKTLVSVPISAEVDSKVMAQIDEAMKQDKKPYFQAALYYLQNGKDLNKALTWFDKAIEETPNGFWIYHQKANALAKLGKKQEATAVAKKSIELAKQAKNEDYVKLNEELLAKLN
jgi:tetratricopeptide (TPR) repeat protein